MLNHKINTPKMGKLHFQVIGLPHEELNQEVYISLDFPIYCPKCKLTNTDIILDGRENKVKGKPQKYECKTCGKNFCTHTSYFFQEVMQAIFSLAFHEVTQTKSSLKEVANRYHISSTTLHDFMARVRGELIAKTELIKTILTRENDKSMTLLGKNKAVFIDETFLKIKGSTYYLIAAVNSAGVPLSWELSSTRKQEVITTFIKELITQYGLPGMIVTDGNPSYKHALTRLRYLGYHVIHIHKDRRNRVEIRRCSFQTNSRHYTEEIVGVNNDIFKTAGTKPIWVLTQQKVIPKQNGLKGRPKGSRNQKQKVNPLDSGKNPNSSSQSSQTPPKKRGPKNVFREGHVVEIRVDPGQGVLEIIPPVSLQNENSLVQEPQLTSFPMFALLYPAFQEFRGQYITSNRIENLFSQFDYYFIPNGRRSSTSVCQEISSWMISRLSFSYLTPLLHHIARSFSSRMAIFNLNKLLVPTKISSV